MGKNWVSEYDGSHGQRLKTPRGPVPRRREEEEEGGRTWEKTCMADSLILPIAPTRGELVVVFTSVMAATCVGGRGAGRSASKTAKLAEKKCADFRDPSPRRDARRRRREHRTRAPRASDAPTHDRTRRRRADRPPPGRVTGRIARGFPLGGTAGLDEPRTDRAARPRLGSATARRSRRGGALSSHVRCPRGNIGIVRSPLGCRADDGRRRSRNDLAPRPSPPNGVGPRRGIIFR